MIVIALIVIVTGLVLRTPAGGAFWRSAILTIAVCGGFAFIVMHTGNRGNYSINRYVPASTITSAPCALRGGGRISSVLAENNAGPYTLYQVTCANDLIVQVAQ